MDDNRLHQRTLSVEGEHVDAGGRRRGHLVERGDVPGGRRAVLGRTVGDLRWADTELSVIGLVRLPLLEPRHDASRGHVVRADVEVERTASLEGTD